MKAVVVKEWGGPEVLSIDDVKKPSPGPGEVLVRVYATSVNPVDYKLRKGGISFASPLPAILHGDMSGVVEDVGANVTRFSAGDKVYGCVGGFGGRPGALAEYTTADERLLSRKPENLSFREAAAVPLVAITAWLALVDRGRVSPHDHLLIQAGAGGVGHVAVQIAKNLGCRISTTVSTEEKASLVKELGADDVIFYRNESVDEYRERLTAGGGFDVVFDTVGGETLEKSLYAVKTSGHVLGIAMRTTGSFAPIHERNFTLSGVFMGLPLVTGEGLEHHGQILETLTRWTEQGRFRPVLSDPVFTLDSASRAHEAGERGGVTGKIVIDVSDKAEQR